MMANDAFFTWVGTVVHFPMWRQMILLFAIIFASQVMRTYGHKLPYIRLIFDKYKTIFLVVFVLSIFTLVVHYFNLVRIGYAWYIYFAGVPYILFPFIARSCGWSRKATNYIFIVLGTFLSSGIFADFLTGGMFTSMFLLEVTQESGSFEAGRFCFLSTAPTIFSIYYCLCLMCCMYEYQNTKSTIMRYILLSLAGFFIFGSLFCGSRQTLVALIIVFVTGLYSTIRHSSSSVFVIILSVISIVMLMPTLQTYVSRNQGIEDRYNREALMEDTRNQKWEMGFKKCFTEVTPIRALIGDGVGQTAGKAKINEEHSTHYENTFFARIIDVGWFIGIWSLIIPVTFIFKYRKRAGDKKFIYLGICIAYLFICCVSPNGASETVQISLFITLGFFIEDANLLNYSIN